MSEATRHAVIRGVGHDRLEAIRRFLPSNYTADSDGGSIFIHGEDVAGWTLDDYVIPRLASGLYSAVEISTPPEKPYLVCDNCGEAFDDIRVAQEHGHSDLSGSAGWCGDNGFSIMPESEAL